MVVGFEVVFFLVMSLHIVNSQVEEMEMSRLCFDNFTLRLAKYSSHVTPDVYPRHMVEVARLPQELEDRAEKVKIFYTSTPRFLMAKQCLSI